MGEAPVPVVDLSGAVALVTGARRGLGKAIALALARSGSDVAINDVTEAMAEAELTAEEIRSLGRKALVAPADVSDAAQADRMIEATLAALGRLDILVNNAGIIRDAMLVRMSDEDWRQVIDVNLKGAFLCTRAMATRAGSRGGVIVNVSSIVGVAGNIGQANYAASKAGLIGLTKACARELAPRGFRVNAIAPGFIDTQMTQGLPAQVRERTLAQIPLARLGSPQEVANVALFLASPMASYITGQVICVDGGMVMG
jgi:3-oxoacyl-[acyl-carrier protein] reductase